MEAVLGADALLLVIDAATAPAVRRRVFAEFADFLQRLEQQRGREVAVAGLPVFLVLTKCDLLASDDDGPADWVEQVEERKREAHEQVQTILSEPDQPRPAWFGRLDLHLWATAVKRPP